MMIYGKIYKYFILHVRAENKLRDESYGLWWDGPQKRAGLSCEEQFSSILQLRVQLESNVIRVVSFGGSGLIREGLLYPS
jgi:hypothetical protein